MKKISVLLVDDHNVVRQGLRMLLEAEEDIEVISGVENGRLAVQSVKQHKPNVVVMDLVMPSVNGLEATRQILKNAPETKVLVLSSYFDDECVDKLTEAGAAGYLIKQTAAQDLVKAIREVYKGNAFFSPPIAMRLRDRWRNAFMNGENTKRPRELTVRELEVLRLIARGFANKQIAAELAVSIKTIEKHRQQLMHKLNIHDIAGLTRYAVSKGMIESPRIDQRVPPAVATLVGK